MLVIGLVGEKGGGKGTFAELLAAHAPNGTRVIRVRFSDILRETLDLWHFPPSRANLQNLSKMMDAEFGNGTLAHAMGHRIANLKADIVILDGVRWEADRLLIRSFPQNLLIYVTADSRMRYERLRARGEKSGEAAATFEQFLEEEGAIAERAIPAIAATADVRIVNEGSVEEFRRHVTAVLTRVAAVA
jgi:dephospho-CoA kinase